MKCKIRKLDKFYMTTKTTMITVLCRAIVNNTKLIKIEGGREREGRREKGAIFYINIYTNILELKFINYTKPLQYLFLIGQFFLYSIYFFFSIFVFVICSSIVLDVFIDINNAAYTLACFSRWIFLLL